MNSTAQQQAENQQQQMTRAEQRRQRLLDIEKEQRMEEAEAVKMTETLSKSQPYATRAPKSPVHPPHLAQHLQQVQSSAPGTSATFAVLTNSELVSFSVEDTIRASSGTVQRPRVVHSFSQPQLVNYPYQQMVGQPQSYAQKLVEKVQRRDGTHRRSSVQGVFGVAPPLPSPSSGDASLGVSAPALPRVVSAPQLSQLKEDATSMIRVAPSFITYPLPSSSYLSPPSSSRSSAGSGCAADTGSHLGSATPAPASLHAQSVQSQSQPWSHHHKQRRHHHKHHRQSSDNESETEHIELAGVDERTIRRGRSPTPARVPVSLLSVTDTDVERQAPLVVRARTEESFHRSFPPPSSSYAVMAAAPPASTSYTTISSPPTSSEPVVSTHEQDELVEELGLYDSDSDDDDTVTLTSSSPRGWPNTPEPLSPGASNLFPGMDESALLTPLPSSTRFLASTSNEFLAHSEAYVPAVSPGLGIQLPDIDPNTDMGINTPLPSLVGELFRGKERSGLL
ncbi:hypothetical protein BDQ12DRAFT_729656 [Crucibulum laeve]|uniref:Uncharacterized protein n=1 Tax=Crucibulum laeve TaxID=68775 RepID=A0A5C3LEN8_9AGAR|nr:hypothetical protein BDQ12DRAFT_729656 [Crucibulum laeve]